MYNFSLPSQEEINRDKVNAKLRNLFDTPIVTAAIKRSEKKYRSTYEPSGLVHCAKNTCRKEFHKDLPGVIAIESETYSKNKKKTILNRWFYCPECSKTYSGKMRR